MTFFPNKTGSDFLDRVSASVPETSEVEPGIFVISMDNGTGQSTFQFLYSLSVYRKIWTIVGEIEGSESFKKLGPFNIFVLCFRRGNCKNASLSAGRCEIGLRRKTYNVLAGSVLSVWSQVEAVLTHDGNRKGTNSRMQVSS